MNRTIFVFGSNTEGRHGAGAAKEANRKHGAIYGQAEGLQGNSYAIITKELRDDQPAVTYDDVSNGVRKFVQFASEHPEMDFEVTAIGCGLAGFQPCQIAPLFYDIPENVILPAVFLYELFPYCQFEESP